MSLFIFSSLDAQQTPLTQSSYGKGLDAAPRPTLLGTSNINSLDPLLNTTAIAPANYDEQLGITFTQDFTGLSYNVTAIEQQDALGYGPAYLLNGLSNLGYWYQVGISWDWPVSSGGYYSGFGFNYEVFSPNGTSIYPVGAGGLENFSGPINPGNRIGLSLTFSSDSVLMQAFDYETGAIATATFASYGASLFVGSQTGISNSVGFFTGLMTEQYHATVYNGSETKVTFSSINNVSSAWMWVDEFNSNTSALVFFKSSPTPVSYVNNPPALQYFFFEGAVLISNAYEFVTGTSGSVLLTVSYNPVGAPPTEQPVFVYFSNGSIQSAQIGEKPATFLVDNGSYWSVSNVLRESSVRWIAANSTSGAATSDQIIDFLYYQQYLDNFSFQIIGGGSNYGLPDINFTSLGQPSVASISANPTELWGDVGTMWNASAALPGSGSLDRWIGNVTSGIFSVSNNTSLIYFHEKLVSVGYSVTGGGNGSSPPQFESSALNETVERTLSALPYLLWLNSGASWNVSSQLDNSIPTQRWVTTNPSGVVNESVISPLYYHQSLVTFQYSVDGNSTGFNPPIVDWLYFGNPIRAVLKVPELVWADYGTSYNFTSMVSGNSSLERWISGSGSSGTILSQPIIKSTYQTQFYVAISQPRHGGGVILSLASGWYNASSVIPVSAEIESGWTLSDWQGTGAGSYSGNSTDPSLTVDSPVTETAVFYPALTISASKGGTVSFEYDGKSSVVSDGHSITIYVPPLTEISLSAATSSDLNIFTSWSGALNSGSKSISLQVRTPEKLVAGFGFNYPIFLVSAVAIIMLAVLMLTSIYRRRDGKIETD
jgi:hypothetical protein